ncbi:MAG: hypothetical protein ABI689_05405 [Thermoanaerobaculia bacterium]
MSPRDASSRQATERAPGIELERNHPTDRDEGPRLIEPRLIAICFAGCVLFGYPILGLFKTPSEVAGLPALFFYLLIAWAGLIVALAGLFESRDSWRRPASGNRKQARK